MPETMPTELYLGQIRKMPLFFFLNEEEIKGLLPHIEVVFYRKDEKIVSQGDAARFLFTVLDGRVYISLHGRRDEEFICTIKAGGVFGEAAIFMGEMRTASVTSPEETTVMRIHRKAVLAFIKKHPRGGNKILMLVIQSLIHKLRDANQELALEKQARMDLENLEGPIHDFVHGPDNSQ